MGALRREPAAPPPEPNTPPPVLHPPTGVPRHTGGEPEAGDGLFPETYALPPRCGGRRILCLGLVAALGLNLFALAAALASRPALALSRSEALLAAATVASSAVLLMLMQIGRRSRRAKRPSS
jgi:hypothetical protein